MNSLKVERLANGAIGYSVTILAPDPCTQVSPLSEETHQGAELIIKRSLMRDAVPCAAVLSPLDVKGEVPVPPPGLTDLTLRILGVGGQDVFTGTASVAR